MHDEERLGPPAVDPRIAEILPGLPRVAALDALLRDVDALRLGLETDLTLAAAAVEEGAPEVAADVVAEDLRALRAFEARALTHLARLDEADRAAAAVPVPVPPPAPPPAPAPVLPLAARRRRSRLLPAAPFAAAAALVGLLGLSPQSTTPRPQPQPVPAAMASWAELERLSAAGAPSQVLQEAAEDFHADIASLLAVAEHDPVAARQALELLRRGQVALESVQDPSALAAVLAESRLLAARLVATLPPTAPTVPAVEVPVDLPPSLAPSLPPAQAPEPPAPTRPAPLPSAAPEATAPARPPVPPVRASSTPPTSPPTTPARRTVRPRPTPSLLPPASPPSIGGGARGAGVPLPRPAS